MAYNPNAGIDPEIEKTLIEIKERLVKKGVFTREEIDKMDLEAIEGDDKFLFGSSEGQEVILKERIERELESM